MGSIDTAYIATFIEGNAGVQQDGNGFVFTHVVMAPGERKTQDGCPHPESILHCKQPVRETMSMTPGKSAGKWANGSLILRRRPPIHSCWLSVQQVVWLNMHRQQNGRSPSNPGYTTLQQPPVEQAVEET